MKNPPVKEQIDHVVRMVRALLIIVCVSCHPPVTEESSQSVASSLIVAQKVPANFIEVQAQKPQPESSSVSSAQPLQLSHLPLSESHRNRIHHHGPVVDIIFASHHEIYIFTPSHLWLYDQLSRRLKGLVLHRSSGQRNNTVSAENHKWGQVIGWGENRYLVRLAQKLFVIDHDPSFEVMRLDVSGQNFMGAGMISRSLSFVSDQMVWIMDPSLQIVSSRPLPSLEQFYSLVSADLNEVKALVIQHSPQSMKVVYGDGVMIFHTKRHIWLWRPYPSDHSEDLVVLGSYLREVDDVHIISSSMLAIQTAHAIMLMNLDGDILKMIPVSAQRSLRFFAADDDHHTYLFDDHHLEVYEFDQKSAQLWYGSIEMDPSFTVSQMRRHRNQLAVVASGQVKFFELGFIPQSLGQDSSESSVHSF